LITAQTQKVLICKVNVSFAIYDALQGCRIKASNESQSPA